MATQTKFRHQDIAVPPAGTKVRTIHAGKHELRIAFPKGARKKGSGTLVSILHPRSEKNPSCGGVLQLAAADLSSIAIPVDASGNGFGQGFEDALETASVQNPTDWKSLWDSFKGKLEGLLHHRGAETQSNAKKNYTEQVKTSEGKTVFINVDETSKGWRAEGYPVVGGKIKRVAKPKIAFGDSESDAYDKLVMSLEKNPKRRRPKKNLDEIDKAAAVAETFNGEPVTEVREIEEPSKRRDDFAHLAWMEQFVFQPAFDTEPLDLPQISEDYNERMENDEDPVKAWQEIAEDHGVTLLVFDVRGDEIELTATGFETAENGDVISKQLVFIGGRQDGFRKLLTEYFKADTEHDSVDMGNLVSVTYEAQKTQLGDSNPRQYYHVFGEEEGTAPRAAFDMLNNRIKLSGGSYHLKEAAAGIVN